MTSVLPFSASRIVVNALIPCFLAVPTQLIIFRYSFAPDSFLKQPDTLVFPLTILISRSAWLLSNGTEKSFINRQTDSLYLSSLQIKFYTLFFFLRPRFLGVSSGSGFSLYAVLRMLSYFISNL